MSDGGVGYTQGFDLLRQGRNEEAEEYFATRNNGNDPLVMYGLMTARFKDKRTELTREEVEEIIRGYEGVIESDEGFADAYVMCAMAYEYLASVMTKAYKDNEEVRREGTRGIKEKLERALELLHKASELNPSLSHIEEDESRLYSGRMSGLDRLEKYYNAHDST